MRQIKTIKVNNVEELAKKIIGRRVVAIGNDHKGVISAFVSKRNNSDIGSPDYEIRLDNASETDAERFYALTDTMYKYGYIY